MAYVSVLWVKGTVVEILFSSILWNNCDALYLGDPWFRFHSRESVFCMRNFMAFVSSFMQVSDWSLITQTTADCFHNFLYSSLIMSLSLDWRSMTYAVDTASFSKSKNKTSDSNCGYVVSVSQPVRYEPLPRRLHLYRVDSILTEVFRCFSQSFQTNTGIVS